MNTKLTDLSWSLGTLLDFAKLALRRILRAPSKRHWLCEGCVSKWHWREYQSSALWATGETKLCACCGRGGRHASVAKYRVPGYLTVGRIV